MQSSTVCTSMNFHRFVSCCVLCDHSLWYIRSHHPMAFSNGTCGYPWGSSLNLYHHVPTNRFTQVMIPRMPSLNNVQSHLTEAVADPSKSKYWRMSNWETPNEAKVSYHSCRPKAQRINGFLKTFWYKKSGIYRICLMKVYDIIDIYIYRHIYDLNHYILAIWFCHIKQLAIVCLVWFGYFICQISSKKALILWWIIEKLQFPCGSNGIFVRCPVDKKGSGAHWQMIFDPFWGWSGPKGWNSLKLTAISPLKMVVSKLGISELPGGPYFQGLLLLVSGRVTASLPLKNGGKGRRDKASYWVKR